MSSVRTSCQLEKSAGAMDTAVAERSRTLLVGPRGQPVSVCDVGVWV
jgi:hypothetical protein